MRAPCYGCPRRTAECHGSCEDYKTYQAEREQIYAARKAACDLNHAHRDALAKVAHKKWLHDRGRR